MLMTVLMFENSFLSLVTITFTALIFIELLNVYSEVSDTASCVVLVHRRHKMFVINLT